MEFKKIQAPSLKELFITQIEKMIISGEFEIGQKLPSERELSHQMGVSRAVVNSGIVEMSRKGFLEIRPRVGTFVADYRKNGTIETLVSIMNYNGGTMRPSEIKSLLELRGVIDSMITELVASKLSDSSISVLEQIVESIEESSTPEEAAENTFIFHHELALMSGNTIVPLIYSSFKFSATYLWNRYAKKYGISCIANNARMFLDYLKAGDVDKAVEWKEHCTGAALYGDRQIYDE